MRSICILLLLSLASSPGWAAEDEDDGVEGPAVVTLTRHPRSGFDSPRAVAVSTRAELQDLVPLTTPDALRYMPAMWMIRTSGAGGSPVLRGLLGNRILLLVDGIRLNTAITGSDPEPLLSRVDPFDIARAELVRGPSSVVLGSDAMGGVLNLLTRPPQFDPRRTWDAAGEATARFHTAAKGFAGHGAVEGHVRQLGARAGGTWRRFGPLLGGRDSGHQRFTSYWAGSAAADARWIFERAGSVRLSYATMRIGDAPQTDMSGPRDFTLLSEHWRDQLALHYNARIASTVLERVDATLSYQWLRLLRERFRLDADRIERQSDDVGSLGATVALQTVLPYNRLSYGVDFALDRVGSSAEHEGISAPTVTQFSRGRFVDDSSYARLGLYVFDHVRLGKLVLDIGGRVAAWNVDLPPDPENEFKAVERSRVTGAGALHGRYLVGDGLNLVAGVSQGFHAPNIADYSAVGCTANGYQVPNEELDPERALTVEGGVKLDLFGVLHASVFYFFSRLDDLIVVRPTTTTGPGGPISTFPCGTDASGQVRMVPVVERDNARSGYVQGVESELRLAVGPHWHVFGWLAWTRGQVTLELPGDFSEPLSRTPPLNGFGGLRYQGRNGGWYAQLDVRWAARQDRLSSADRGTRTICPLGPNVCRGTGGFAAVNLRGAARLHDLLRLTLTVENLTNESYRLHGSALDEAGLSALIGMELTAQ